jgi:Methyladenine glycosylase
LSAGEGDVPTIPDVVDAAGSSDYLAIMTRAVFQAGVSWHQIARHWNAYVAAFEGFDPKRVALYDAFDVDRILATPGVLRMRRKVDATIANAKALVAIEGQFGTVEAFVRSYEDYGDLVKDFKKRFSFMGDMNVWYVLFRARAPVPRFEPWVKTIRGDHPRMREMVERARAASRSSERD